MRRTAAPTVRLRRDGASALTLGAETGILEEKSAPFGLVRGHDGLQRTKRGAVSEGDKGSRFHGPHGADEAIDDDITDFFPGLPL